MKFSRPTITGFVFCCCCSCCFYCFCVVVVFVLLLFLCRCCILLCGILFSKIVKALSLEKVGATWSRSPADQWIVPASPSRHDHIWFCSTYFVLFLCCCCIFYDRSVDCAGSTSRHDHTWFCSACILYFNMYFVQHVFWSRPTTTGLVFCVVVVFSPTDQWIVPAAAQARPHLVLFNMPQVFWSAGKSSSTGSKVCILR